jgi:hypothetical protein
MFRKNRLFTAVITFFLFFCLTAIGTGSTAVAQSPASNLQQGSQTIPYSGRLTNLDGRAVGDGNYDFTFSLYDAPDNGNLLWTESQAGVVVRSGDFNINLGQIVSLPESIFGEKEIWIEVSVRGPGESSFTLLLPRQMISPQAPAETDALTCPHNHFTDYWNGNSIVYGLEVDNGLGVGDGIRVYSAATASNYAAIYAINQATSGSGRGVYASSAYGTGIFATSMNNDGLEATTNAPLANNKSAIFAHAPDANGVWAISTNRFGVFGSSTNSIGVQGTSSTAVGVYGLTSSPDFQNSAGVWGYNGNSGTGVRGLKEGGAGVGVYGTNYGSTGSGAWGYSTNYMGVFADTERGDNNYGFYTPDNLYSLNYHLMGAVMQVVQNGGTEALEPGDVAVFVGIVTPTEQNGSPIIQVARSTEANSTAVAGVVYSRIDSLIPTGGLQATGAGAAGLDITPAGPAEPGEYLLLVVQGPALVNVSALSGAINPGDLLSTSEQAGYLTAATQVAIGDVQIALPGTVLGKALEPLAAGSEGFIYIFVTLH